MLISYKIILYIFMLPMVLYSLDSLNINMIFKKNSELKARLLYFFVTISLTYLVVSFLTDVFTF